MNYLNNLDYTVIIIYFILLVSLGLYLKKRASASLEDYFLGGRRLPWWALGISGMASFLDITGTMIIVSFLYMLGPRGLFIEFRGGAVLVLPFMLLWTGKWHRRSGCMTGAKWMVFRFGEGAAGQFARIVRVLAMMLNTVGMLAYLVKGVGLFLSMFLPFSPLVCSLIMIGIASLYTMVSGFYGVVFTDMFQSFIILTAVIAISTMAMLKVSDVQSIAVLAQEVTGRAFAQKFREPGLVLYLLVEDRLRQVIGAVVFARGDITYVRVTPYGTPLGFYQYGEHCSGICRVLRQGGGWTSRAVMKVEHAFR